MYWKDSMEQTTCKLSCALPVTRLCKNPKCTKNLYSVRVLVQLIKQKMNKEFRRLQSKNTVFELAVRHRCHCGRHKLQFEYEA